ncbi:winged helix family transcriptional regulator [Actinoplanes sp. ATCC 53533]|uniref:winged helix-turn-helix domain-containing protein n=1 Tax=Actinoplanes sp. ATCC 53533 TaxID=1288362 RepID=UPI000F77C669|nr:winged helix-turn-helix domain-containing protein [Actinoplanes sp. ATCC 53533]RSM73616.1 winged helix family transcriptional regulator [Actinoplanes sp. ATCC 53533]
MSVLAVADLSLARSAPVRRGAGRPRAARLRPIAAPDSSVTVTITLGAPGSEESDRVLEALRDLVAAAGPGADVDLVSAGGRPALAPAVAGLHVDTRARTVTQDGRGLDLSRLEYELLLFLSRHPRQVFSRSQLLGHVWGHTHTTVRTVDVHVSRLRTKLGDPEIVTTVYGVGYRLSDDARITVADD